jgi:hypothetical protein
MATHGLHDDQQRERILAYLAQRLPGYPFDEHVDGPFVDELLDDFPLLDILEQIKRFRWYRDNQSLSLARNPRGALRRWISRAHGEPA